ncbi:MAG: GNAT family N-acetyltransferase [Actinomycetaceae bacterium]|nr:GNAT family N-acetyltransferase [Actinomycetaceae bacterium]
MCRKDGKIFVDLPKIPSQLDPAHKFEWRLLGVDDAGALADLLHRIEKFDGLPYRTSLDEVKEFFSTAASFIGIGGFVDDVMRAYGHIRVFDEEPVVASCQGGVDPEFRNLGFGGALVSWHTESAQKRLAEIDAESKQIAFNVEEGHRSLEEHLLSYGYEWSRSYYDLRAALDGELPDVELDPFVTIAPWGSVNDKEIIKAVNRIAMDEDGRTETSKWTVEDRAGFTPEWSFVALDNTADRPQVAGFIMASKYAQDWSVLGWREGTIDMLAVLPDYRGTNIAVSLVTATMRAQADSGMEAVLAGLSSSASTSVMSVYDSLGFRTVTTSRMYTLQLD